MKALARRLAAVEYRRTQHQHRRIVWPSVAAALRAGVTWPILMKPFQVRGRPLAVQVLAVWRWPDTGAHGMGKRMGRKEKAAREPLVC